MSDSLLHAYPEPGVCLVELHRPLVHNALNRELVDALRDAVDSATQDSTRAVVLTSHTRGLFCGGADLSVSAEERRGVSDELYVVYERMLTLPVPVIAAIDGPAVGGGAQLALAADVRVASHDAAFRFAGPAHGLAVGTWALPSTVGRRAMELVLSQRFLPAEQAWHFGLVDRLDDDPRTDALALARNVAELDFHAVQRAKEQVVQGEQLLERLRAERAGNGTVFDGVVPR